MGGNVEREKVVRKMFDGYERVQRELMTYMGIENGYLHGYYGGWVWVVMQKERKGGEKDV